MKTKHGFTLVELLVVIAIIGILATIITVAVSAAMRATQRGKIGMEMGQIAMSLDRYNAEFGEYPPDMFDDDALVRHVRKRWPRYELPQGTDNAQIAQRLRFALSAVYRNANVYLPDLLTEWTGHQAPEIRFAEGRADIASLALWLGGFPNQEGRFEGFSADPEAPFGRDISGRINRGNDESGLAINTLQIGTPDKKVFAELEVNKNVFFFNFGTGGTTTFAPCLGTKSGSTILPIVYFSGNASAGDQAYDDFRFAQPRIKSYNFGTNAPGSFWSDCGIVVPYARSDTGGVLVWNNPATYQLIHPGLDGKFGSTVPGTIRIINPSNTDTGIGAQDLDNITNFSDNKELKSVLP